MFCVTALDQPSSDLYKVAEAVFEEMSNREDMMPAPYFARAIWITISQPSVLSTKEWQHYITESYEMVKKIAKKIAAHIFWQINHPCRTSQ